MDSTLYKDLRTSRGLSYHYYLSTPKDSSKHTILLLHGFPSTSYDWYHQVDFFEKQGYGVVVPDLLGYGGTDKPETAESYRMSLMVQDVIDILEYEKLNNLIAIGHDWGTLLLGRLAYYHPGRFIAFGFLASPYMPPDPSANFEETLAATEKAFGYPIFGYQEFFSSPGAAKIIEEHIDSFYSLLFPSDPFFWREHLAPLGKAKEWVTSDRTEQRVSYLTEEEYKKHQKNLLHGGLAGPLCWYKQWVHDHTPAEERKLEIDSERLVIQKPVFFGAALHDYVCLPQIGLAATQKLCPNAKVVEFESDHWIHLAVPERVNKELLDWITKDVESAN